MQLISELEEQVLTKMPRFIGFELTHTEYSPIHGYVNHPLLPLYQALEPVADRIDQLDHYCSLATSLCNFPSQHGLTREESAAIYLYTMDCGDRSFYRVINSDLRSNRQSTIEPWFAYLKLFITGVKKLPLVRKNVWRGVPRNIS